MIRIERRHCGPADSAHGGVAVGRFAELVGAGPVEVRLVGPPPLETDLEACPGPDGSIVVRGPAGEVARVRALDAPVDVAAFDLVSDAALDGAEHAFFDDLAAKGGHAFPTCFGCGPERDVGDGLRQFAGRVPGEDTVAARFYVAGDGPLPRWMAWAGLDCPSGGAVGALCPDAPPAVVLGTMSGQIVAEVEAGVEYQVRARLVSSAGRKHTTEVAMLAPDGTTVGAARAVWIAVDATRF